MKLTVRLPAEKHAKPRAPALRPEAGDTCCVPNRARRLLVIGWKRVSETSRRQGDSGDGEWGAFARLWLYTEEQYVVTYTERSLWLPEEPVGRQG